MSSLEKKEHNINQKNTSTIIKALILFIAGIFLDQFSKKIAIASLKDKAAIPIIKNVFELQYLENHGAAFGILQNHQIYFLICVLVITVLFFIFYKRMLQDNKYIPLRICAVFIMAGAWGNAIDRVVNKYVVDFFYFKIINFPIFNVADIYVTVATFTLAFLLIFYYKEEDLDALTNFKGDKKRED